GLGGEPLVGRDVLDEAEQLGRERWLRQRRGPDSADPCRHLDRVVVGEAGEGAVVPQVDDLDVAAPGRERGDELRRRLAVVGAAAPLEQGRFGRQRRVAVELEQLMLDLGDLGSPGLRAQLLLEHPVVEVEVAQIVGRNHAQPLEQRRWQVNALGQLLRALGEQVGEDVVAVDVDGAHPGQVVEADLVDEHPLRLDAEHPSHVPLQPDRDVAEADGAMAGVEQAAREPADDLAPLRIDVVQDELAQVEPLSLAREARHELRRIGRAAADDGQLHRWERPCPHLVRNTDKMMLSCLVARVKPWESARRLVNVPHEMTTSRAIPTLLRDLNERAVLETIRTGAPISRAEISRRSGISKPTVSLALESLLEADLVREAAERPDGPGYGAVYFE